MSLLLNLSTASSVFPLLGRQDVHVWYCDLLRYAGDGDILATLLSGDEQARAARFVFERDRQRFILSHGLLRLILARYLDLEPRQVQFVTGVHGKPAVGGSAGSLASLEFSLSHSGDYAFMALAPSLGFGAMVWIIHRYIVEESDEFLRTEAIRQALVASFLTMAGVVCWYGLAQARIVEPGEIGKAILLWFAALGLGKLHNEARL